MTRHGQGQRLLPSRAWDAFSIYAKVTETDRKSNAHLVHLYMTKVFTEPPTKRHSLHIYTAISSLVIQEDGSAEDNIRPFRLDLFDFTDACFRHITYRT